MDFISQNTYHIYNRGNNRQTIFFTESNYVYFLQKVRKYVSPHCDLLAYVLMPNHFHFLIHANEHTEKQLPDLRITRNVLSEGIRLLLSSYTKGINKQEQRTGNLIQQKTKSKCISDSKEINYSDYGATCFYYIHQNPLRAGLVNKIEDWHYSSYRDYAGLRNGTLCNQELAKAILNIPGNRPITNRIINEESIKNIW